MSASRPFRHAGRRLSILATLASLGLVPGCGGHTSTPSGSSGGSQRVTGQTDYLSAALPGQSGGASFGSTANAGAAAPVANGGSTDSAAAPASRTVQETDIYRVSGNRLYYLNSYRGLMIFDITNVDSPQLIGRSAIFGDPQEMLINGNVAVVVIGDWYGNDLYGSPFHGSIVRGLDCTDPANIKTVGEAQIGGYVQDTRVVGNVLYTVAQDYGWEYGWEFGWEGYGYYGGGVGLATPVADAKKPGLAGSSARGASGSAGSSARGASGLAGSSARTALALAGSSANNLDLTTQPAVVVSSINFATGTVQKVGEERFDGYNGVFYVTSSAIILAHQDLTQADSNGAGLTDIQYVDISDAGGAIKLRGRATVNGAVSGWGPDNGRWNLDFQDGSHAHALGCAQEYCGDDTDTYVLSTVDFTDPDAPTIASETSIASLGWSAAARFDSERMYLSPSTYASSNATTPMYIYDLSNAASPTLAGQANLNGDIWMFIPDDGVSSSTVFALGDTYSVSADYDSDQVQVQYIDVTDATNPKVINAASFGAGWSWSPVADTFKAFTVDDTQGLAVVPFSGWDSNAQAYTNGLQLLQFSPTSLTSVGTARTTGWVERGIFVGNRLLSLSDLALSVVDYTNPAAPKVTKELTLARNVVSAVPQGATIAELSSDWWGNDQSTSEMRVLPIGNAQETTDNGQGTSVAIPGVDANVFNNGSLSYVVSTTQAQAACPASYGPNAGTCTVYSEQVQVVDTSNGGAVLRGKVTLPNLPYYDGGWGWEGFWYYDWFDGADAVQVGTDALAFRRWYPQYSVASDGSLTYDASLDALYVVDLSNPDQPAIASLTVTEDPTAWWGNVMAIGNTLYTTHFEWVTKPAPNDPTGTIYYVKYYLDQVDLTDRANPKIGQKINAPGVLVGASTEDPTVLYFADYRWDSNNNERSDIAVAKIDGGKAFLQSVTPINGWVGNVIVQNDKAYMTAQEYDWMTPNGGTPYTVLHQLDLTNPSAPADFVSTDPKDPFGWLLAVEGDRAIVTSGWGPVGVDIYKLSDAAPPAFSQSALSLGWWSNSIARQGNTLYLTSGYWGVQAIPLE